MNEEPIHSKDTGKAARKKRGEFLKEWKEKSSVVIIVSLCVNRKTENQQWGRQKSYKMVVSSFSILVFINFSFFFPFFFFFILPAYTFRRPLFTSFTRSIWKQLEKRRKTKVFQTVYVSSTMIMEIRKKKYTLTYICETTNKTSKNYVCIKANQRDSKTSYPIIKRAFCEEQEEYWFWLSLILFLAGFPQETSNWFSLVRAVDDE